jgi:metallo-beta-lactamase family protein
MQLEFFGAAGEVTGSCHILRVRGATLLLDCGMIQGGERPELRNRADFPFDAAQVTRPGQTLDLGRLADVHA